MRNPTIKENNIIADNIPYNSVLLIGYETVAVLLEMNEMFLAAGASAQNR